MSALPLVENERLIDVLERLQPKLLVFDGDGTLTPSGGNAWIQLTRGIVESWGGDPDKAAIEHAKHYSEYREIYAKGNPIEIGEAYRDVKNKLFKIWSDNGKHSLHLQTIHNVVEEIILRPQIGELRSLIELLQAHRVNSVIITASFDVFAQRLSALLGGIPWYANSTFGKDETLDLLNPLGPLIMDFEHHTNFAKRKVFDLEKEMKRLGMSKSDVVVAFGDDSSDEELFRQPQVYGFAIQSTNQALLQHSIENIQDFNEVLEGLKNYGDLLSVRNRH